MGAILGSERCWEDMVSLCESVVSQKEAAERVKEVDCLFDPLRRIRPGRRMRQYAFFPVIDWGRGTPGYHPKDWARSMRAIGQDVLRSTRKRILGRLNMAVELTARF